MNIGQASPPSDRREVRLACALTAAVAGALYAVTLATGPAPGEPAALIVKHAGISESPPLVHPIWTLLCHWAAAAPWGTLALRIHALCAALGAAGVYMAARLAARMADPSAWHDSEPAEDAAAAGRRIAVEDDRALLPIAAGVITGLTLALSAPYWMASTRASTAGVEAILLLGWARLLIDYIRVGGLGRLAGGMVWVGLGASGSAAGLLHAPLGAALACWGMAKHGHFPDLDRRGSLAGIVGSSAAVRAGLLPALVGLIVPMAVQGVLFAMSAGPRWVGIHGGALALAPLRALYADLKAAVPRVGWIVIALDTVVPAALLAWAAAPVAPARRQRRLAAIAVVLLAWSAAIAAGTPLSPWPLLGAPRPPALPYLWIALWTGGAAGALMWRIGGGRRDPVLFGWRRPAWALVAAAAIAPSAIAAIVNFSAVDGRATRPVGWLAEGVAHEAAGARWLITGGLWDDVIAVAAHDRHPAPILLRWGLAREPSYLAAVADRFRGQPLWAGLAEAGLEAMVSICLRSDTNAAANLAVVDVPEVLARAGIGVEPGLWTYAAPGVDRPAISPTAIDRWRFNATAMRRRVDKAASPWKEYGRLALRHASRVMNDRGVRMEELRRPEEAIRAYTAALAADSSNLVAAVNLSRLARGTGRLESERIDQALVKWIEGLQAPLDIVAMGSVYGRLYDPAAAAERGQRLARSGRLREAVTELWTAMALGGTNDVLIATAAQAMAGLGRPAEALELLGQAESSFPESRALRAAKSRIMLLTGLPPAEPDAAGAPLVAVLGDIVRRDWRAAEERLRALPADVASGAEATALSTLVAFQAGQSDRVRTLEAALRSRGNVPPLVTLSHAGVLLTEGRRDEARRRLAELLVRHPAFSPARRVLAQIELEDGHLAEVRQHLHALLRQNPDDSAALFSLATLHLADRRYDVAEAMFRHLLQEERSAPALNSLAWTLWKLGRTDEALPLIEEAAATMPNHPEIRDTRARILYSLGRRDAALADIEAAERLSGGLSRIRAAAERIRAGQPLPPDP